MSDAAEREGSHETPVHPPDEPQEAREPDRYGGVSGGPPTPAAPDREPPAPTMAEPGIYRCIGEVAGEGILGILTQGQEYDYSRERDPRVLQAVAAYVEIGVLEPTGEEASESRPAETP